ncbi:MAG: chemotaxis protein CheR, partial [Candidatus Hydrogenedentes bacterium]|nr:chemotaxis protein CheR [Candidatus Hydrogenedentota bacterium]
WLPRVRESRSGEARRVSIWSAACCTGEEPFSLAIMLRETAPELADWRVTILATDINTEYLGRAARGEYGEWSFRGVAEHLRWRYFEPRGRGRYALSPDIRRMVTFTSVNLADAAEVENVVHPGVMDLILCDRNVQRHITVRMWSSS